MAYFLIIVRSSLFNALFYLNLILFLIFGLPLFFGPRIWAIRALQIWARISQVLLAVICDLRVEIRHQDRVAQGALLIASKHQSLFDTFALLPLFDDPAMVLKRELTWIPLYGWFSLKFKMISVDRSANVKALKSMLKQAKAARDIGRQIVVFPEGTRREPGDPPDYKSGIAALYAGLDLPCVPIALNSGQFWPRRRFIRRPGTIIIEFLEPIQPGLKRPEFMKELKMRIENATSRLERAAKSS